MQTCFTFLTYPPFKLNAFDTTGPWYFIICKHTSPSAQYRLVITSPWTTKLELSTEKEGCMSYTTPEDAQRPRAVYDIHPDFRGI